ncbi:MAG: hypothetical protein R2697_00775 [Ilumatobacteraceae bacterium]
MNDMGPALRRRQSRPPATVPDALTAVDAATDAAGATVTFVALAANGDAITGYTVTARPAAPRTLCRPHRRATSPASPTAPPTPSPSRPLNGVGTGPASTPSSDVVPAGVPAAPSDVTASRERFGDDHLHRAELER